jgi:hypothetical protein
MSRIVLIVAFALVVGSRAIVAAAQGGTGQTEAPEAGAQAGCGTPVAALMTSPVASPDLEEIVETATPEIEGVAETMATAATTPEASPVGQGLDGCATPAVGTPVS